MPEDVAAAWLVDKPAGPTSHDVVAQIRRRLGRGVRVGHAGTLDPFATGLLVVLAGRATRLVPWLSDLPKSYRARVRLGARSVTGDPEGPITPGGPVPAEDEVTAAVAAMRGPQRQRVPAHSAVRVGGERLYRRARRGEDVEAPERSVVVYELDLVGYDRDTGDAVVDARVSKGTYLRQLAADLGEGLGCGGYCAALRRTAVGGLTIDRAVAPDVAGTTPGLPLREVLAHLPYRELDADEEARVAHGVALDDPGDAGDGDVVLLRDRRVVAVARRAAGRVRPAVVLAGAHEWARR